MRAIDARNACSLGELVRIGSCPDAPGVCVYAYRAGEAVVIGTGATVAAAIEAARPNVVLTTDNSAEPSAREQTDLFKEGAA
ncbi:MAG: hypothetical protein RI885_2292 [Actinomycetota bacterium]|jgi:hypothetical protein